MDPLDVYASSLVPMVVEQTNRGERSFDIYSRLLTTKQTIPQSTVLIWNKVASGWK